jgi:hypothetical protein
METAKVGVPSTVPDESAKVTHHDKSTQTRITNRRPKTIHLHNLSSCICGGCQWKRLLAKFDPEERQAIQEEDKRTFDI